MPGLAGFVSSNLHNDKLDIKSMLASLSYGRAVTFESYEDENFRLGCTHLGTGAQQSLYQSDKAVVMFFGYLTEPAIPPGADASDSSPAAHFIHDQYITQGESMMCQLAGAFAFAILDKRTKTLLLASDHLGLRPIYYAEQKGIFRFSSEVKGILDDPSFPHRINRAAIAEFFHFNYALGDKTFFQDIHLLPPASLLRYHDGHWNISNYWDISWPENYPHHSDEWYDELIYNALKSAVKRMANPKICYGLSLSGGMDSRWIAAFLSQVQPQSKSFTIGIPGSDDTSPAKKVADQTGIDNYYWDMSPRYVADLGEYYSYLVDGMYDLFSTEEFPLTIRIGNYVDVSVGGFLGDCLFGHEINPISASLRKNDVMRYWLWRNQDTWHQQSLDSQVFGEKSGKEFETIARTTLKNFITSAPCERGYQVLQYINIRNRQPHYINIAQQAKLSFVDLYHPIADLEVVKAALQLPPNQLMLERAYRRALAAYFPNLAAIPWTFTLTSPNISIPSIILKKTAQLTLGKWLWGTPLGQHPLIRPRRYYADFSLWSRSLLRRYIEKTLFSPEVDSMGIFDMDGLRAVIRDHMEGTRDVTSFIGQALAVAFWSRLFYTPSRPICPHIPQVLEEKKDEHD